MWLCLLAVVLATSTPPGACAAFASLHPRLLLRAPGCLPALPRAHGCTKRLQEAAADHSPRIDRSFGAVNVGMRVKLQKQIKTEFGFQRWWDGEWRSMQTDNIKDPEAQFDAEVLYVYPLFKHKGAV